MELELIPHSKGPVSGLSKTLRFVFGSLDVSLEYEATLMAGGQQLSCWVTIHTQAYADAMPTGITIGLGNPTHQCSIHRETFDAAQEDWLMLISHIPLPTGQRKIGGALAVSWTRRNGQSSGDMQFFDLDW